MSDPVLRTCYACSCSIPLESESAFCSETCKDKYYITSQKPKFRKRTLSEFKAYALARSKELAQKERDRKRASGGQYDNLLKIFADGLV
jgi:predicted nucleic acid-binding Zn ribbon protein